MSTSTAGGRFDRLDAWRGAALLWMTAYHFGFDLVFLRVIAADFHRDPFWTLQRTAILSLFLACAGAGQVQAHQQGLAWSRFWKRWAQVAACAALVSLGSWLVFPRSFIYMGVLHALVLLLPLARLCAGWRARSLVWAALLLLLAHPVLRAVAQSGHWGVLFDAPAWNWLGLVGRKPITEDYVPLLPWVVPLLLGMALARRLADRGVVAAAGPLSPRWHWLCWAGRHSLSWYMLHQPILLGLLGGMLLMLR